MATVAVNGKTINYSERGEGQAVVLVHGFPLDSRIWDDQIEELSKYARVIAVDLPGFGKSKSETAFSLSSMADDLHAFFAAVNARPAVLAGLSMGGYIALAYVTRYPTELCGLILVDTRSAADDSEGKKKRDAMIQQVRQGGSKAVAETMLPKMLAPPSFETKPQVVSKLNSIMENCPALTIENALVALRDRPDYSDELPSIAVPTCIIVGDSDAITPPTMAGAMNRAIPHSRLHVIKNAGHLSPMEQPDEVTDAMRGFLTVCMNRRK